MTNGLTTRVATRTCAGADCGGLGSRRNTAITKLPMTARLLLRSGRESRDAVGTQSDMSRRTRRRVTGWRQNRTSEDANERVALSLDREDVHGAFQLHVRTRFVEQLRHGIARAR